VGVNELELAFAYTRSDTSLDTSLIVAGARLDRYSESLLRWDGEGMRGGALA
jgi:hypothetical protein